MDRDSDPADGDEPRGISDTTRISSLADGVFAIVMTLLVLGVEVPEVPDEMIADQLFREVLLLWPLIAAYVVSFLVLGIYWMGHHTGRCTCTGTASR